MSKKHYVVDAILIKVRGTPKFKQMVIDAVYAALMADDLAEKAEKSGNGFTLESTLVPSEEE